MAALNISHELLKARSGPAAETDATATATDETPPPPGGVASLSAKLDEALHQLRQLEIG